MGASAQGIAPDSWTVSPRTLVFIRNGSDVLLMKRAAHMRVFPGRYNGVGGHIEPNEDALSSALREVEEETGLKTDQIRDIRLRGITYINAKQPVGIILFIFTAWSVSRTLGETEEGALHWVALEKAHKLPLVEDLPVLLARLFGPEASDALFFAQVGYDEQDRMVMIFAGEDGK